MKKGEENRRRRRRRRREEKKKKSSYGIVCMDFYMDMYRDTCLEVWNTSFFVDSLFGMVVVLNGGKICIEKMLGFRGDAVRFF